MRGFPPAGRGPLAGALAALALGLTACGGGGAAPANQTMNHVLASQPPKSALLTPAPARVVARGWDFTAPCPSPAGQNFGASYVSNSSKDWTLSCVRRYHAAGAKTVVVWETSGTTARDGFGAGVRDASRAKPEAARLGNFNRPIYFALDWDVQPSEQGAVNAYFRGVASVIGLARTGAYGGYWPISRLFNARLIKYGWQTYAWSGGNWDRRAQLEQWLNGNAVDLDRAISRDYGQWPYAAPRPPKPPKPPKPPTPPKPPKPPKPPTPPTPPTPYDVQFDQGFQRGYVVRWDRKHHRAVPPGPSQSWFTPARQTGYNSGYHAA